MRETINRIIGAAAATCAGLLLAGSAHAIDQRSWDQKITDASKRFVVLAAFNSEAVLDKETQLVWQRYMSNVSTSHSTAWRACSELKVGGRMGWRMPTLAELTSLIDPSVTTGAKLPAGHPFLTLSGHPIPASIALWSATFDRTSPQDPTAMATYRYHTLDIDTADVEVTISPADENYLCVRGPDPVDAA